jgi:predicted O-linked N-acetylglucosamine transferase (SPINDLY family)
MVIAKLVKLLLVFSRSRLFLKSVAFSNELTRAHYRGLFAAHGVQANRLEFAGHTPRNKYLAADPPRLAELRSHLRTQLQNFSLCDGSGFVRDFEAAYRKIWKSRCHIKQDTYVQSMN